MASDGPAKRIDLAKANILIVESSSFGMQLTAAMLAGFGARSPARASSAEEAMAICRGGTALDLIVCDPALDGGEDGYAFVSKLRQSRLEPNAFAPVLLIPAHTPRSQVQRARDCGAHFVVAKPLTPRVLLERILWIAREGRPFIDGQGYVGPDRRFQALGAPDGTTERRQDEATLDSPEPPQNDAEPARPAPAHDVAGVS